MIVVVVIVVAVIVAVVVAVAEAVMAVALAVVVVVVVVVVDLLLMYLLLFLFLYTIPSVSTSLSFSSTSSSVGFIPKTRNTVGSSFISSTPLWSWSNSLKTSSIPINKGIDIKKNTKMMIVMMLKMLIIISLINPFSGIFYLNFLDRSICYILEFNANSVDPDQTPRSAASDPGLHCLPMSILWDARLKGVNWILR